jgi:GNAT superfamily N-acetyltransferase
LTATNGCALVAEHPADGVVGMIFGRITVNERYLPSVAGVVDQVFVHEAHRRSGVGTMLMARVCRYFAGQQVTDLSLRYVVGNQQADAFWRALGFEPRILTVGAQLRKVEACVGELLSDAPTNT